MMNTFRLTSFAWLVLSIAIALTGCSTKTKNLDTPEGTMTEAERLMKEEFFEEARTQFFRIKSEFPNSSLQVQADLRIADSYYEEESYAAAVTAYEDFVRTYPGREEIPYAIYRLGKSHAKQRPSEYGRDSRATEKAVDAFTRLIVDHPQSEYREEALKYINESQDQLAQKAFSVARFYETQDKFLAAAIRYGKVYELYTDHPLAEEALARRVRMYRLADRPDEAQKAEQIFRQQFPNSKFVSMIEGS